MIFNNNKYIYYNDIDIIYDSNILFLSLVSIRYYVNRFIYMI